MKSKNPDHFLILVRSFSDTTAVIFWPKQARKLLPWYQNMTRWRPPPVPKSDPLIKLPSHVGYLFAWLECSIPCDWLLLLAGVALFLSGGIQA